jgi:hypothetical protein
MAMQESGKGADESDDARPGPNPTLSSEQAEEFAASFTPAWATDDDGSSSSAEVGGTAPDATHGDAPAMPAPEAAATAPAPAPAPTAPVASVAKAFSPKQTLIGTAPPANAQQGVLLQPAPSSAEAIEPENILEANTAPPATTTATATAAPATFTAPHAGGLGGTMIMGSAPAQAARVETNQAPSRPPPGPTSRSASGPSKRPGPASGASSLSADPFGGRPRRSSREAFDSEEDFIAKKSNKTLYVVVVGLAVAAGIGLFVKSTMSTEAPRPEPVQQATGPAVTTAEIPPPPPPAETPAAPSTPIATAVAAPEPPPPAPSAVSPAPHAAPADPSPHTAAGAAPRNEAPRNEPPRSEPKAARSPATAVAAAQPVPPPPSPKTPPKAPNGGIVRDNPF